MGLLLQLTGQWGHALAAVLFAALGLFIMRRRNGPADQRMMVAALLMTAGWALLVSFGGMSKTLSSIAESIRNAAWLLMMFVLLRRGPVGRAGSTMGVSALYAAVAALILIQVPTDVMLRQLTGTGQMQSGIVTVSLVLRMMTAIGCLLLVHQLYTNWPVRERGRVGLLLGVLAAMWTYDLNLYTIRYFAPGLVDELFALRGPLMALLAPIIAAGVRKDMTGRLQLSRAIAFQSVSLVAFCLYLVALTTSVVLIELIAGPYARIVDIAVVFLLAVTALLLLPSPRLRAMWKVQVAKHFFQHRYDYRTEWMRFGETIGRPGENAAPLAERVAKAVSDITDSPAAILLLRDERGGLSFETHWNWDVDMPDVRGICDGTIARMEQSGWIVDLGTLRADGDQPALPGAIMQDRRAWALVPLVHYGRLIAAILLARPPVDRRLDWEDFDMLRAAGGQAATYISEAQGQQALADAQRFDEFNRRFAFIMHDVKNLVSQLSLLARNAERHADNPDFRADMILSLKESAGKMNDMLARLSQHNKARVEDPRPLPLRDLIDQVAATRARHHPVHVYGAAPAALADPVRVEQIVSHLLQNAIDASAPDSPVELRLSSDGADIVVDIVDHGRGMSAEYIRRDLFKPFSSSKAGGFGIGAFEALALAQAMGGRIDVESAPGVGSRFTLRLPAAPQTVRKEEAA